MPASSHRPRDPAPLPPSSAPAGATRTETSSVSSLYLSQTWRYVLVALWILLQLIALVFCIVALTTPEWFRTDQGNTATETASNRNYTSQGLVAECLRGTSRPENCGRYGDFEDIPTREWKAAVVLLAIACFLLLFSWIVSILLLVPRFFRSIVAARILLPLAFLLELIAILLWAGALDVTNEQRSDRSGVICPGAAHFDLGACEIGYSAILLIVAIILTFIAAIMAFLLKWPILFFETVKEVQVVTLTREPRTYTIKRNRQTLLNGHNATTSTSDLERGRGRTGRIVETTDLWWDPMSESRGEEVDGVSEDGSRTYESIDHEVASLDQVEDADAEAAFRIARLESSPRTYRRGNARLERTIVRAPVVHPPVHYNESALYSQSPPQLALPPPDYQRRDRSDERFAHRQHEERTFYPHQQNQQPSFQRFTTITTRGVDMPPPLAPRDDYYRQQANYLYRQSYAPSIPVTPSYPYTRDRFLEYHVSRPRSYTDDDAVWYQVTPPAQFAVENGSDAPYGGRLH